MCIVGYPITTQNALACEFINAPPCDPYHISLLQLDRVNQWNIRPTSPATLDQLYLARKIAL